MSDCRHNPAIRQRRPFSLVELLTVMVIVAVLLAVTVPTVIRISSGSSVESGSRMVGSQLRLARQEAITRRRHVAVLFPVADTTDDAVAFTGFRACFVDGASASPFAFAEWVPNTSWAFLPVGAVLNRVRDTSTPTPAVNPVLVTGVPGFAASVRAVVFKPVGRLGHDKDVEVRLEEGTMPPGAAAPVIKGGGTNWIDLLVNTYTGRVTYQRPEDVGP